MDINLCFSFINSLQKDNLRQNDIPTDVPVFKLRMSKIKTVMLLYQVLLKQDTEQNIIPTIRNPVLNQRY